MLLETQVQTKMVNDCLGSVSAIILLYKNPSFKDFNRPFDLEISGKKMWKYVEMATSGIPTKTTLCTPETDVLSLVKPMLSNSKWTLILYSDTPLIQKRTIREIVDYAENKGLNALRLTRGYIFNTEYLKTAETIYSSEVMHFGDDDFVMAFDIRQFEFVSQILKSRIIEFHQQNGVLIMDNQSTFIDADVVIESGVIIYPQNSICGTSIISKNTVLKSGNYIENSVVGSGAVITHSCLINAKVEAGKTVTFEKVEGQK